MRYVSQGTPPPNEDAPAGVMEQEQAYLAALDAINGYFWEQSRQADGVKRQ